MLPREVKLVLEQSNRLDTMIYNNTSFYLLLFKSYFEHFDFPDGSTNACMCCFPITVHYSDTMLRQCFCSPSFRHTNRMINHAVHVGTYPTGELVKFPDECRTATQNGGHQVWNSFTH